MNLDEYENTGTHWVSLFFKPKYTIYFDSFGVEHIPKEGKKLLDYTNLFSPNDLKKTIELLKECLKNE